MIVRRWLQASMKTLLSSIIIILNCIACIAQNDCNSVIVNDSLFNANPQATYGFSIEGKSYRRENIDNITWPVSIIDSCVVFTITTGGGCGEVTYSMATNGVILKDEKDKEYLELNFHIKTKNTCKRLDHTPQCFSLREIAHKYNVKYYRFKGFYGTLKLH